MHCGMHYSVLAFKELPQVRCKLCNGEIGQCPGSLASRLSILPEQ